MTENLPYMTIGIIAVTTVISFFAFNNNSLITNYKFDISAIRQQKKYFQFISSGFLHADYTHLLFNMFSFYSFSAAIELNPHYGMNYVLLIYFAAMLAGNLLSFVYHKNDAYYSAVGASGAVCGIIYASIFMLPGGKIILFMIPYPIPA